MKKYLKKVFRKLFYRSSKAEYFRFADYNEFLIIHFCFWLPFVPLREFSCERAIGNPTGHQFANALLKLERQGVRIIRNEITREEFDRIARFHPILKNDPWVNLRLKALDCKIARK